MTFIKGKVWKFGDNVNTDVMAVTTDETLPPYHRFGLPPHGKKIGGRAYW
jgi:hypothetical protein